MAINFASALGSDEASLALLKVFADSSFDSILVTDATEKGNIIYANKAFKKLTGYDPEEVIGKTPRILQGPGTDRKGIYRLSHAIETGGRFEGRAVNYRKDGTPFIMNWRMLPIKVKGTIVAWFAIQREAVSVTNS